MKNPGLKSSTGCWTQEGQAEVLSLIQCKTFCQPTVSSFLMRKMGAPFPSSLMGSQ